MWIRQIEDLAPSNSCLCTSIAFDGTAREESCCGLMVSLEAQTHPSPANSGLCIDHSDNFWKRWQQQNWAVEERGVPHCLSTLSCLFPRVPSSSSCFVTLSLMFRCSIISEKNMISGLVLSLIRMYYVVSYMAISQKCSLETIYYSEKRATMYLLLSWRTHFEE